VTAQSAPGADLVIGAANLAGANLAGASLEDADLSGAVLDGADLDRRTANKLLSLASSVQKYPAASTSPSGPMMAVLLARADGQIPSRRAVWASRSMAPEPPTNCRAAATQLAVRRLPGKAARIPTVAPAELASWRIPGGGRAAGVDAVPPAPCWRQEQGRGDRLSAAGGQLCGISASTSVPGLASFTFLTRLLAAVPPCATTRRLGHRHGRSRVARQEGLASGRLPS
jgi:Pentapeptide repeats (8 copies)